MKNLYNLICLTILLVCSCETSKLHPDLQKEESEISNKKVYVIKKCTNCNGTGKIKKIRYVAGRGKMNERTISYGGKVKQVYYKGCHICNGAGNVNK